MPLTINQAIKQLRIRLNETQIVFATRIGSAAVSVSRYENSCRPKAAMRHKLESLARSHGWVDIANTIMFADRRRCEAWLQNFVFVGRQTTFGIEALADECCKILGHRDPHLDSVILKAKSIREMLEMSPVGEGPRA